MSKPNNSMLRRISSLLFVGILLIECTGGQSGFQQFEPENPVNLNQIKAEIPAILSLFEEVDDVVVNEKSNNTMQANEDNIVRSLMTTHEILKAPLPELINSVSYAVDQSYLYYQFNQDEFNRAFNIGGDVLNIPPEGVVGPTAEVAEVVRYFSAQTDLYASAATLPFPDLNNWSDCDDDTGKFANASPNPPEAAREKLLKMYTGFRMIRCLFKAGYGKPGDDIGHYIYNYFKQIKDSKVDLEAKAAKQIAKLESSLDDIKLKEENLADWLAKDPDKAFVTDYLTRHFYRLTKKDQVFNDLKPIVDLQASHFSMKDPDTGEHLTRWLLNAVSLDADKFWQMESHLQIETNNPLMNFANKMIDDNTFGFKAAVTRYGGGDYNTGRDKFINLLWDGSSFTDDDGGVHNFTGLLFNDGLPKPGNDASQNYSHFRLQMHDCLNGDCDGNYWGSNFNSDSGDGNPQTPTTGARKVINPSYYGETAMQASMTNFYLATLERYFSPAQQKWALNPADGLAYFGDRDRNIQSFLGNLQYALRNAVTMDKNGRDPGDAGYQNISWVTTFLYVMGVTNGKVKPSVVGPQLLLKTGLTNMGSALADEGMVSQSGLNMRFFCNGTDCSNGKQIKRNGRLWSPNLYMFMIEAFSPGRFVERNGGSYGDFNSNSSWVGNFTPQQADAENANANMGTWLSSVIPVNAWQGYGPYSYKGKAPNGSKLKYKNDFFTDRYSAQLYIKTCKGLCFTPDFYDIRVAMGNNTGGGRKKIHRDDWDAGKMYARSTGDWYIRSNGSGTASDNNYGGKNGDNAAGNLHVFEKIYIPANAAAPCWTDAAGPTYGYARYGYLRPSMELDYNDNSKCTNWNKVQVDFDNREAAIKENFKWLMEDKKIVAIIPVSGGDKAALIGGMAFANFYLVMGNGLMGLLRGRSVGPYEKNGDWNFFTNNCPPEYPSCSTCDPITDDPGTGKPRICPYGTKYGSLYPVLNATSEGVISNFTSAGIGMVKESPAEGATATTRLGRTSFEPGDSGTTMLMTMTRFGIIGDGGAIQAVLAAVGIDISLYGNLFGNLGTNPMQPALLLDNASAMETIPRSTYDANGLLCKGEANNAYYKCNSQNFTDTANDIAKFRKFYDKYFKSDAKLANGTDGTDGIPDLFQAYLRSITYPGCDNAGTKVDFCYTAEDMPPIPKVNGITYPDTFNANGTVATWYTHNKPSEGKMISLIVPIAILAGTSLDGSDAYIYTGGGSDEGPCTFSGGLPTGNCRVLTTGENIDSFKIKGYVRNGFRTDVQAGSDKIVALNESKKSASNNTPAYNSQAFLNAFIESSAGARDGFLPSLFSSKYFNLAFGKFLKEDLQKLLQDSANKSMNNMELFKNNNGGTLKNRDKFRYFTTGNAVGTGNPFTTNYLQSLSSNSDPIQLMKKFVVYLRTVTSDGEVVDIITQTILAMNRMYNINGQVQQIDLENYDVEDLVALLNEKNADGSYTIDSVLDYLASSSLTDINSLTTFQFSGIEAFLAELKTTFDELNAKLIIHLGRDLRKDILYKKLMGEPYSDTNLNGKFDTGEPFYDHDEDGKYTRGTFAFRDFYPGETFTDTTNVNGTITITTNIPNFFNLHGYDLTFDPPEVPQTVDRTKLLDFFNSMATMDFNQEMDDLKNDAISGMYDDTTLDEPNRDRNQNGTIEGSEFVDVNDDGIYNDRNFVGETYVDANINGKWDAGESYTDSNGNGKYDGPITVRLMVKYIMTKYKTKYQEWDSLGYVTAGTRAFDELGNPNCIDYSQPIENCIAQNTQYMTARLFKARKDFMNNVQFDPDDLTALKNVVGTIVYDRNNGVYTYAFSGAASKMVRIMKINQGQYVAQLDNSINALRSDGPGRYVLNQMRLGSQYKAFDILQNVRALFNMKVMREYDNKNTFWFQVSKLIGDVAQLAYEQKKMGWTLNPDYFERFQKLFE